jgi:alkylation response protein AidB-like acyl-CoA dehydrogenase
MDLAFTQEDEAFRAEARSWLHARVPAAPLPSLETEEGFAAHRAWEAELAAERRRHGIPLPPHLHAELTALGVLGGPGSPR